MAVVAISEPDNFEFLFDTKDESKSLRSMEYFSPLVRRWHVRAESAFTLGATGADRCVQMPRALYLLRGELLWDES